MASKIKMLKLIQESRAVAEMEHRPALPPSSPFCIPQFRPKGFQASLPIRRIPITILDPKEQWHPPQPVRIIFLKPDITSNI